MMVNGNDDGDDDDVMMMWWWWWWWYDDDADGKWQWEWWWWWWWWWWCDDDDDDMMMMLMVNGNDNDDDDGDDIIVKYKFTSPRKETTVPNNTEKTSPEARTSQIARIMGPTWGPPGSCRPQLGLMWAPWTLLSGMVLTLYSPALDKLVNSVFPVLGNSSM